MSLDYDENSRPALPPLGTTGSARSSSPLSASPAPSAPPATSPLATTSTTISIDAAADDTTTYTQIAASPANPMHADFSVASPASVTTHAIPRSLNNDFVTASPASVSLHFAQPPATATTTTTATESSENNNSINTEENNNNNNTEENSTENISVENQNVDDVRNDVMANNDVINNDAMAASPVVATSPSSSSSSSSTSSAGPAASPKEARRANKDKLVKAHSHAFNSFLGDVKSGSNGDDNVESGTRVGLPYGEVQMHGFLYKKSRWYTKVSISSQMWQRRWFVLGETFWYCRNPLYPEKKRREIPLWKAWKICLSPEDPCTIDIYTRRQTYVLRASDEDNARRWARALKRRVKTARRMHPELYGEAGLVDVEEDDEDESLLEFPYGASPGHIFFWAITLPFALLFTFTIPDVKKDKCKRMFPLTFVMVLVWLAVMSYAMIWGASMFAKVLHIPEDIMGVSITAIGASLPSLFGSVIAAKQGSAKMAISNAFGANLCSILLAFGLPCFFYSAFFHHGEPYVCGSGAIFVTVTVLFLALIVFLIIAAVWKLKLNYIHGIVFIVMYVVLLTFVILSQIFNIGTK